MEICIGCAHANNEMNVWYYSFVFCKPLLKRSMTTPKGLFEHNQGPNNVPIGKMKFLLQCKSLMPMCTVKITARFQEIELEDIPEYISSEYSVYKLTEIISMKAMQPSKEVLNICFFNGPKKMILSRSKRITEWIDVTPSNCRWSVEQMFFFMNAQEDVFKLMVILPAAGRTWYIRHYDRIDAAHTLKLMQENKRIAALCSMLNSAKDMVQFDYQGFFAHFPNELTTWAVIQQYSNRRRISGKRIFEQVQDEIRPLCKLTYSPVRIIREHVIFKEDIETVEQMVIHAENAFKILVGDIDFIEYINEWNFVAPQNLHSTVNAALGIQHCKTPEENCGGKVIILYTDLWGERDFLKYLERSSCIFEHIIWHLAGHTTLTFRPSQNISKNLLHITKKYVMPHKRIGRHPQELKQHLLYGKDGLKLGKLWVYVTQSYEAQQRLLKEYDYDNNTTWKIGDWVRANNYIAQIQSFGGANNVQKDSNKPVVVNNQQHPAFALTQGKIIRMKDIVQTLPRVCYFGDMSGAFHEYRAIFRHTKEAVVHHTDSFAFCCSYKTYENNQSVAEFIM